MILKPLSRAIADGDRIYCLIRGSAANNDGFSNGLTAPNPKAQESMLRAALRNARRRAGQHPLRRDARTRHDPRRSARGQRARRGDRQRARGRQAAALGSVKTNLGHLESAAGIAGPDQDGAVAAPPRAGAEPALPDQPNPHIPFEQLRLKVQTELESWPSGDEAPRAGVSSFGFGGARTATRCSRPRPSEALLLPLASVTSAGLRRQVLAALARCGQPERDRGALSALAERTGPGRIASPVAQRVRAADRRSRRCSPGGCAADARHPSRAWCSCSPATARSGWAWAARCCSASRCFAPRSRPSIARSSSSAGWSMCRSCSPTAFVALGRPRSCRSCCSPRRSRSARCGCRGACGPTRSSVTASARSRPPTSRACSRCRTRPASRSSAAAWSGSSRPDAAR